MATDLKAKLIVEAGTTGDEQITRLADELQHMADAGGQAAPELQQLAGEMRALAQQQGLIDQFARLKTETASYAQAQQQAQEATKQAALTLKTLQQTQATTGAEQKKLAASVKAAEADFNRNRAAAAAAGRAYQDGQVGLQRLRDAMAGAGVSSGNLAAEQVRVRREVEQVRASAEKSAGAWGQVGRGAQDAGRQAEQAMGRAAASTGKMGDALGTLQTRVAQVFAAGRLLGFAGDAIATADAFGQMDTDGYYLPAFTNQAYVSARRDTDTQRAYSTMEFGFGLVVACPDRLRVDDEITVRIETVDGDRPYQVGDEAIIRTVGAGPAWLAGGVDGSDVQTWRVSGSASGALTDCLVPTDGTPVPLYSAAGIDLQLQPGGIAFALGDSFSLAVEAGQFRWRQGGGAWSALADIPPAGPAPLADGLLLHFDPGAAPSFVPGDAFAFAVHQPWAASHVQAAQASSWGWAGSGATLLLDLGAVQPLGALALARYDLPAGATVTAELSADGLAWGAPLALNVAGAVCVQFMQASARHVRLTVANAPGGHIGWLWAGVPLATDHHASSCQRRRRWAARRGDGVNAASLYAGVGDGWALAWQPGDAQASRLLEADAQALLALADWAQQHDEPLLFVPHAGHPQDAALVRLAGDALELTDLHEYQSDDAGARLLSATLELEPVFA